MFNTYSYKTVALAGIQRNQAYKKNNIKIKKNKKLIKMITAFKNVLFLFYLWLRMYTFV